MAKTVLGGGRRARSIFLAFVAVWSLGLSSSRAGADVCVQTHTYVSSNPVLSHPQVTLIFWGKQFAPGGGASPTAAQILGATQDLFNGPYFSGLNQYHNAGSPALSPNVILKTDTDPPVPFKTVHDIGALITGLQGNRAPIASPNVDNVYGVILAPNAIHAGADNDPTHSTDDALVNGHNKCPDGGTQTAYGCHHYLTAGNGAQFYYFWAESHARMTYSAGATGVLAHELAETIVHPDTSTGNSEVGDDCGASCGDTIGVGQGPQSTGWYYVQAYYSMADGRCIAPRAWGTLLHRNATTGNFDPTGAGPLRQAYASSLGVVATDNQDPAADVWLLPEGGSWTPIGIPAAGSIAFGSMFAATDTTVYGLTTDMTGIWEYLNSGTSWYPIQSTDTFSSIYGGGPDILAAPAINEQLTWIAQGGNWTNAAAPMSALVVNQTGVYGLSVNHDQITEFLSAGTIATNTTDKYQTLYGSAVLLSTTSAGSIWNWNPFTSQWFRNGSSSGYMFAAAGTPGTPELYNLNTVVGSPQRVYKSPNVYADPPPTWTFVGTSGIGKLVTGGKSLYALTQACPPPGTKPSARTPTCP